MKSRLLRRRIIAIAVLSGSLLAFWLLRGLPQCMDMLVACVTKPYHTILGWLTSFAPFSVAELVAVAFILCVGFYIVRAIRTIVREKQHRKQVILEKGLGLVIIGLSVCVGISFSWGAYYYATSFETRAGLEIRSISVQQLAQVTQLFADKVNSSANDVPRTELGVMDVPRAQVLEEADGLYEPLEQTYPFLKASARIKAKPLLFSEGMSIINYTGIFFPFTGEANVNIKQPLCFLPSTIAHELAHVRGIAPEQTANFIAVLACEQSNRPAYVYSGYLLGYLHLSNALYGADRTEWSKVSASLCPQARADLADNNLYWEAYDTPASEVADTVYEGFLKSYDQEMGLKSYGAVVDLLVAYYGDSSLRGS